MCTLCVFWQVFPPGPLAKSGIIPFNTDEFGFNPGEFLSHYLELTNTEQSRLFQRPQRAAKWFNIHDFGISVLYENKPMGKNVVGEMLRKLCKAAGVPTNWTNHCLRTTGITNLKSMGIEDRAITNLSGKHSLILLHPSPAETLSVK